MSVSEAWLGCCTPMLTFLSAIHRRRSSLSDLILLRFRAMSSSEPSSRDRSDSQWLNLTAFATSDYIASSKSHKVPSDTSTGFATCE